MALWSTFKWSDGTKWVDARGSYGEYVSFIDRSARYLSPKVTFTNATTPGSLLSFVLQSLRLEVRRGPQLSAGYEAFIDTTINTQYISPKITHTAGPSDTTPFSIDRIFLLMSRRSRRQPTG